MTKCSSAEQMNDNTGLIINGVTIKFHDIPVAIIEFSPFWDTGEDSIPV